jgi:hypothetical protein
MMATGDQQSPGALEHNTSGPSTQEHAAVAINGCGSASRPRTAKLTCVFYSARRPSGNRRERIVTADSPSWRAYTGQTLEEWLGYGWLDATHPDDRAYAEQQWRKTVATLGFVNAEFRLRAPDGGWRWTNVRAVPVLDAGGQVALNDTLDQQVQGRTAERDYLWETSPDLLLVTRPWAPVIWMSA